VAAPPPGEPRYPYVEVRVEAAEAEEAGACLFELGAQGVEQRDEATLLPAAAGATVLIASFASRDEAEQAMREIPPAWSPRLGEVVGDGWRDEWKKHFEPFELCDGIVIRPPWHAVDSAAHHAVIVLEPGRAFGTGLHETTALVARSLADRRTALRGASVLDVGCGSGILSLVALAFGARTVRAIDVDREAVEVTRENAQRAGVLERLHADATPLAQVSGSFDVVVANIEAAPLVALAADVARSVAPGGFLVLSGILAPHVDAAQWPRVRQAYATLRVDEERTAGQWLAAVLRS
jgi:ribosomal protein L11 methyltransferase